jgi:hypothetical protein
MIDFMHERLHKVKYYATREELISQKKAQTLEVGQQT